MLPSTGAATSAGEELSETVIRPYGVARLAALPVQTLQVLRDSALGEAVANLAACSVEFEARRELLSNVLYDEIGRETDASTRRRLLQLRRVMYKGEIPKQDLERYATSNLSGAVADTVADAIRVLRQRAEQRSAVRDAYRNALTRTRAQFQELIGDPDFQKGLLLSSRTLYSNVVRYRAAPSDALSSRDEQIERGLLRYFSRAVMKATPFATFCGIGEGKLEEHIDGAPLTLAGDPRQKRSHVRINKTLYPILWTHLKSRPSIRRALGVDINPTLEDAGSQWRFLANVSGREIFQRLSRNPAIDHVVAHVRAYPGLTLQGLASGLAEHESVDANIDEAATYVEALVRHGLLTFRSFVAEQDADWDLSLRTALESLTDEHARRTVLVLAEVRKLAERYVESDVAERRETVDRVRSALLHAFAELGIAARVPRDLAIYEDASVRVELRADRAALAAPLARLAEWVALTQRLASPRMEQATMRHYFDARYAEIERVPLLTFYEDYYRDHFKPHLERQLRARHGGSPEHADDYDFANPLRVDKVQELLAARARLHALIEHEWSHSGGATAIDLDPAAVRDALDAERAFTVPNCRSASVFCQLIAPSDALPQGALVIQQGQYFVGYGKYFSRFLYMLPRRLQERVLADNSELGDDDLLAEICGDAHFNANLHPRLLPWEIRYPTGESTSSDREIAVSHLEVMCDPADDHALVLIEASSGRRVLPVDLGFLSPRRRPPLYQLLTRFTPGGMFAAPLPDAPRSVARDPHDQTAVGADTTLSTEAERTTQEQHVVLDRPRITFGGSLVLARRRWSVPSAAMPRPERTESDSDYFVRLTAWRAEHAVPTEAYVRVIPHRQPAAPVARPEPEPNTEVEVSASSEGETQLDGRTVAGTAETGPRTTASNTEVASDRDPAVAREPTEIDRPSRDWMKPQYMDFASPLFVRLFAKLPGYLTDFHLEIEEALPGADALPTHGSARYVSELVLQVDIRNSFAGTNHFAVAATVAAGDVA